MVTDWNAIAAAAYEAYGQVTDHKNYQQLPMPEWEQLPPRIQEAWQEAVKEAVRLVQEAEPKNE
jgi:hypothetical protein